MSLKDETTCYTSDLVTIGNDGGFSCSLYTISLTVPVAPLHKPVSVHRFIVSITFVPTSKEMDECNEDISSAGISFALSLEWCASITVVSIFSFLI